MKIMNSNNIAKVIYNALDEKKGLDIKIIDIREISVLADYLIIAGGTNKNQVQALADNVEGEVSKIGIQSKHVEGYASANWILLDYSDIIVHVFNQEDRLFYDLERLWKDGKTIDIDIL